MAAKQESPASQKSEGKRLTLKNFYSATMPFLTLGILIINLYMYMANNKLAEKNNDLIEQNQKLVEAANKVATSSSNLAIETKKIAENTYEAINHFKNPSLEIYCALKCDFEVKQPTEENGLEFKAIDYCLALKKARNNGSEPPRFYYFVKNQWSNKLDLQIPIYYILDIFPRDEDSTPDSYMPKTNFPLNLGSNDISTLLECNSIIQSLNDRNPCDLENNGIIRIRFNKMKINKCIGKVLPNAYLKTVKYMKYQQLQESYMEEKNGNLKTNR